MDIKSYLELLPGSVIMIVTCCLVLFFILRFMGIPIIKGILRGFIPTFLATLFLYFVLHLKSEIIVLLDSSVFLLTSIFGNIREK